MSANPYLDALDSPAPQQPTQKPANPYLVAIEGAEAVQRTQLQASLRTAMPVNPDEAAKARQLSARSGIPQDVVTRNLQTVEQQEAVREADFLLARHPYTASRMRQPDFAQIAHDDLENLSLLEQSIKKLSAAAKYIVSAPDQQNTLLGDIGAGFHRANRGAAGVFQSIAELPGTKFDAQEGYPYGRHPFSKPIADFFAQAGARSEARAKELSPAQSGVVIGGVSSGVQSLTQNLLTLPIALLPGGQTAALTMMSAGQGGQSYQQAREQGVSPGQALPFAASQAAIEYATEKIPLKRLLGDVKTGASLLKTLGHQALLDIPGEQVATILQDLNEWAVLPENKDKTFKEYLDDRPSAAAQTLIATIIGVGGQTTIVHTADRLINQNERRAQQAEQLAADAERILKLAEASRLRERDPASFRSFVEGLANEGEVPAEVYISSELLANTLNQSGISMEDFAAVAPVAAAQIANAQTDTDIRVPVAEFATADPALVTPLLDHIRATPDSPTRAEAAEFLKAEGDTIKAEVEGVLTQREEQTALQTATAELQQGFEAELGKAGRFTPEVNKAYASLLANFYAATGSRLGLTPQEVLRRYGVRVQADLPKSGKSLDQAAFHGSPHRGIEQFTTQKIGTGEGAQAYGWGMYFAENKDIAEFYRRSLSSDGFGVVKIDGQDQMSDPEFGDMMVMEVDDRPEQTLTGAEGYAHMRKVLAPWLKNEMQPGDQARLAITWLDKAEREGKSIEVPGRDKKGQLYEVEVPESDDMLDYDATIAEQPEKVRKALEGLGFPVTEYFVFDSSSGKTSGRFATLREAQRHITANNLPGKPASGPSKLTGKDVYEDLSARLGSDEAASRALLAAGVPGLQFLDAGSRGTQAKGRTRNFVIFDDSFVKKTREYYQGAEEGSPRANISLPENFAENDAVISLLAGADLSSFIHESGHLFLEIGSDIAIKIQQQISEGASVTPGEQQIVDDFNALLEWFGIKGNENQPLMEEWASMSFEQKRQYHEQFARGFEAYTMEGQAPSQALKQIFQKFRSWLVQVYKTLRNLNVELTEDVRKVMGRMLATDFAIEEAEAARNMGPLFESPEKAGMTAEEYEAYQLQAQASTERAAEQLQERSLKDMKWLSRAKDKALKARQAEVDSLRREIRNQVQAEVMAQPVYRAWDFLTGRAPKQKEGEADAPQQPHGKLSTSEVKYMAPALLETLKAKRMVQEKDGLHPDAIAEDFEYPSGQQMMLDLADALPPQQVIDNITDQRMLEVYGDITSAESLQQAADEAVHNEARARFIASELKALQAANTVREGDESQGLYRGRTIDVLARAAKDYATQIVQRMRIRDLRPDQYAGAEARNSKLAQKAFASGKLEEAALHKRNQLVNNYAAKAAYDAKAEIQKALDFFAKVNRGNNEKLAETRDPGIVQAARAILAEYGLSTKGKPATDYLSALAQNDPGMHQVMQEKVSALTEDAMDWRDLPVERFMGLADEIRGLWHLSKRSRQVEIDGELIDKHKATMALRDRLDAIGVPDRVPGEGRAVTDTERKLSMLQSGLAALRRVESWVTKKDGGESGPFHKYVWQPVREAADRYRLDKAKYLKKYRDLLKTVELGKSRIDAPEIGYTFGFSRGGSGKQEIIHALLHTGNDSNKRKLLLGRGWATENEAGVLDTSRWDRFVQRMIDEKVVGKAEFDFVQGVWDLLEEMKPLAQKTHRDVFGAYFDEVTANEVVTPFGIYRGGYVPAMTDAEVVRDAKTRDLMDQENQTLAQAFPTTSKGFTKARVEYNRALLLDLRSLSQHIDKVLMFSHLEQPVRDVRKILGSADVAEPLNRVDPASYDGLLTPWLNRAARQQVEAPVPGSNGLMRFFSKARSRAGMAAMFANISNTAQQITGLSIAAVKVKPKYLLAASAQMVHSPRTTAQTVADASDYMATRMDNEVAQMSGDINDILLNPSVYEKAQTWTQKHAYFMQSAVDNFIGPIVWMGAYNQALEGGATERDAVRAADSAVRQTQGSTLPEDIARFETGNAFVRMFTQFAGYFNMQANLLGTEFSTAMHELGLRKGMGRGLYVFTLGFLVPAMVSELIVQAFRGGPEDDDKDGEYLDDWLAALGFGTMRSAVAMVPVLGQVVNASVNTWNKKPYDDRISTSPAISMIESAVAAPHSVYKAVFEDGSQKKAVRDLATLISLTTGLPANAIARPLSYLADVNQGKVNPTSEADLVRGLATGAASPQSK